MPISWRKNYNLLVFDEIDSTNSEAVRLAKTGTTENYIILANSQNSGRGRYGKVWKSEPGNLYASLLLNKNIPIELQSQLSFVTAIAMYDTISSLSHQYNLNLNIKLKWPNDVLIRTKKIAGILLESLNFMGNSSLIIGIGINIKTFPVNVDQPTTSLLEEGIDISSRELLNIFMTNFEKFFLVWQIKGFVEIRKSWLNRAAKLAELITINDGKSIISGIFQDIDLEGNIRVKIANGEIICMSTGQVFFGKQYHE